MDIPNNTDCCFSKKKIAFPKKPFATTNKHRMLLCVCLCLPLCASAQVTTHSTQPSRITPSLSGTVFHFHEANETLYDQYKVKFSKLGLIISDEVSGVSVIQNVEENMYWVVNAKKSIYQAFFIGNAPDQHSGKKSNKNARQRNEIGLSNLLSPTPCGGYDATFNGYKKWHGLLVSQWHCLSGELLEKTHLYSEHYQFVVREKTLSGWVSELRNIKQLNLNASVFKPDNNSTKVGLEQWFGWKPLLEPYQSRSD